mgnify:CR=1 FL=1
MISTCIITNRLDDKLQRAINSVVGLGEVIVVDTQGQPGNMGLGDYYTYPWRDDFAAARNFALEKARGNFILSLDSDEWIDESSRHALMEIAHTRADRAFWTTLRDWNGTSWTTLSQVKIFPNRSDIRFYGRIHEQITPSLYAVGIPIVPSRVIIYHDGYADKTTLQAKRMRNRQIASDWVMDEPGNEWARFWKDYIERYQ